jgi:PAS domain S-box-containing protein
MAPPRLFLRFALFSGAALVVAVGSALLLARWNAHDRARDRAVGEATAVAKQLAQDDLAQTAFQWPPPAGEARDDLLVFLDDFFGPTVSGHDPAKVVLYSPEGFVTYAIDRELIGTQAQQGDAALAALASPRYAAAGDIQDAYVPVSWAFVPDQVRGVMRVQHDYRPIRAELQAEFLRQAAMIALALLGLYLAMLPIMRRVTSSLRRSYVERAELAAIVDHSNDAIIGQTTAGVITSWNAGAEAMYGWKAAEVVGRSIDVLLLPESPLPEPTAEPDAARTAHVRKDGSVVWVSVTVSPVRDANGEFMGSSMIARDVTEVKRLERALRESHRQEAVGRLAGGIARDFEEVLGEIDAAAANLLPDRSSQRELEKIRHATARGVDLAEQLLAVGGAQAANPELIDLNDAITAAGPKLAELAGPNIAFGLELEDGLGPVFADREQVEQLILHLAANARDSMPGGGSITIQTANVDFARRSREGQDEPGHFVMFAVGDTGAGLSAETRARPFEPFFRRSDGGERMALGLAAACGIVNQSGGTMGVESRPGGGTVIRMYLPRVGVAQRAGTPV